MAMMPFHTAIGLDMLWFAPWMPSSVAATFGTCVGLFFLALLYRSLFAARRTAELYWAKSIKIDDQELPRFSIKVDVCRGLIEGFHSFVGYLLMLAVMTMNAWFFIAIILGIIVGETAFGRFYVRGFGGYIQTQRC
jgi:hypothetical protein